MTVFSNFLTTLNKQYSEDDPIGAAKQLFKDNVGIGEAIVSVLSSTGIAGFKFHIPQSEQVKFTSDITDYYTDSNSVIQDHIARQPITITLTGMQGEYFYSVNEKEDTLAKVVPTMNLVAQFLPKLSAATMQIKTAYNKNLEATQEVNKSLADYAGSDIFAKGLSLGDKLSSAKDAALLNGVDLFKLFQELYKLKSAQTRAFLYLRAMWMSNKPFTVETSWCKFDNMLIQNLVPLRDNNADITEFSVTFKQINFTSSEYTDLNNVAKLTRQQLMQKVNKGVTKGEQVDVQTN